MKKQMMVTKAIAKKLPKLEEAYEQTAPFAYVHYFHIVCQWHWYVLAGEQVVTDDNHFWRYPKDGEEPNDWRFLAKVYSPKQYDGDKGWEIGTLYLSDFDQFERHFLIPVERDICFNTPKPISKCEP